MRIIDAIEVNQSGKEGTILDDNLTIACKENAIKILLIQKEGKKILKAREFLAGYKILKGENLNWSLTIKLSLNIWERVSLVGKFKKKEKQFRGF